MDPMGARSVRLRSHAIFCSCSVFSVFKLMKSSFRFPLISGDISNFFKTHCIAIVHDRLSRLRDNQEMKERTAKIAIQIATFFGIGSWPRIPGTWATLATVPIAFGLLHLNPVLYMGITFFVLIAGVIACEITEKSRNTHDDGDLVIDEVVGFLITMTWLPITWQSFVFGFFLFRFLDILKPFPVNLLDKRIEGGLGVMLDDVAAGILANVVLQVIYTKTNWLGSQLITL